MLSNIMAKSPIHWHGWIEKQYVTASWTWYDQSQGLVKWTFLNPGSSVKSVILYRSGYYFGNAFWPVYEANSEFGTQFATELAPLVDNGVENNSPPLAVIDMGGNYIVAFVFTLSPGQTWSMLEGGFVDGVTPTDVTTFDVVSSQTRQMCVGYSTEQVTAWDQQTGTSLQGYSPNPSTFNVVVANVVAPFVSLFNDPITSGGCASSAPQPKCEIYLNEAIGYLDSGNMISAIVYLFKYIDCLEQRNGVSNLHDKIEDFMRHVFARF